MKDFQVKALFYSLAVVGTLVVSVQYPKLVSFKLAWLVIAYCGIEAFKQFKRWQEWNDSLTRIDLMRRNRAATGQDIQQAALQALSDAARGRAWITRLLVVCIAVPSVLELFVGVERSVAVASVEPVAIRAGEWWRLLTGTYLHGSYYHFTGNMSALLLYGSILETKTSRYRLPLVYLLSCLGGSALSFITPPDVPSIGASGGIVGVIGYLFLFSRRRTEKFPAGFRAATASVFAGLVTMGAIGFWYIDNAGHAGGALTGIILAGVLVDQAMTWGEEISMPILDFLGVVALAAIVAGSIATCYVMLS